MDSGFYSIISQKLESKKDEGTYKVERILNSSQGPELKIEGRGTSVINFCANNYLGLASHPAIIESSRSAMEKYGFGMASVRFICGTDDLHKELEKTISQFFGTEETILYTSCFDANGGLFESVLSEEDVNLEISEKDYNLLETIMEKDKQIERILTENEELKKEVSILKGETNEVRVISIEEQTNRKDSHCGDEVDNLIKTIGKEDDEEEEDID